jgi:hypothetical protein
MAKDSKLNIIEFDTDAIRERERAVAAESDEAIIARLRKRFDVLNKMTAAVKRGDIRGLIVSGPPGVGKSFGVEDVLQKKNLLGTLATGQVNYEVVKGVASAIGIYTKLWNYREPNSVIVFDDCDSVFFDPDCLNTLKSALDSSKRRWINWTTDSRVLRTEGIPDRFEFNGGAIFITNIKFDVVRSKKIREHLNALESRCHYIDLEMDTVRERLLRIRQIVGDGMLEDYEFQADQTQEILDYIESNTNRVRELSLRMVLKVADLVKAFPEDWRDYANDSCLRRSK